MGALIKDPTRLMAAEAAMAAAAAATRLMVAAAGAAAAAALTLPLTLTLPLPAIKWARADGPSSLDPPRRRSRRYRHRRRRPRRHCPRRCFARPRRPRRLRPQVLCAGFCFVHAFAYVCICLWHAPLDGLAARVFLCRDEAFPQVPTPTTPTLPPCLHPAPVHRRLPAAAAAPTGSARHRHCHRCRCRCRRR
jgi:hypothetical protein